MPDEACTTYSAMIDQVRPTHLLKYLLICVDVRFLIFVSSLLATNFY